MRIERKYPPDELPENAPLCELVDRDLLEYLERRPGATTTFVLALEIQERIQTNAFNVEAMVAAVPLGNRPQAAIEYLIELHKRIFLGTEIEFGGRLRRDNEEVYFGIGSRRKGTPSPEIVEELTRIFRQTLPVVPKLLNRDQVSLAGAKLLYGILQVHPFLDGNGRTARYMFKAFVHKTSNFVPLAFQTRQDDESEQRYLMAIQEVDQALDNDERFRNGPSPYAPLADYLLSHITERDDEEQAGDE